MALSKQKKKVQEYNISVHMGPKSLRIQEHNISVHMGPLAPKKFKNTTFQFTWVP